MKSYLHGRTRVTAESACASSGGEASPSGLAQALSAHAVGHGAQPARAPRVETVRENGRVVRLVVTCACGERVEVACDYE